MLLIIFFVIYCSTTDCLGHVALLTDLLRQLAINKPKLSFSISVVFIVDEEAGGSYDNPIGVDGLAKAGYLDKLKYGPMYWVDCAGK